MTTATSEVFVFENNPTHFISTSTPSGRVLVMGIRGELHPDNLDYIELGFVWSR